MELPLRDLNMTVRHGFKVAILCEIIYDRLTLVAILAMDTIIIIWV
jgi:hypothetical protein